MHLTEAVYLGKKNWLNPLMELWADWGPTGAEIGSAEKTPTYSCSQLTPPPSSPQPQPQLC